MLYSSGGNFLDTLPDPGLVARRLAATPVRVHQDIVVTSQMLVDPGEVVVLLPAATRYEQRDGGTETTTERRIAFSPQIQGPKVGEARTEWEILTDLAARVDPERAHLITWGSGHDDPGGDRERRARCTRASRACARRATRCSGAASASATAGSSRPPTAAPTSPWSSRPSAGCPRGT